ncbi:MAG: hypothetical protein M1820_006145 [Bogoriella megaspora]|nr:MAG: hypothetical protein M1820_006145 [Bogoriella megaspora]
MVYIPLFIISFLILKGEGRRVARREVAPQAESAFSSYVALGDSWASGNGPTSPLSGSANTACHRTTGSYPYQFHEKYGPSANFGFLACGGANTTEITSQISDPDFGYPDFVTLDAGGDDNHFASNTVQNCIVAAALLNATAYSAKCNAWLTQASALEQTIKPGISALITNALTHNLLPDQKRKVIVTGYAQPFNVSGLPSNCPITIPVPPLGPGNLADRINLSVLALNAAIAAAAYENGALFAEVDAAFEGHRLCDGSDAWFQTDPNTPNAALAHPTADGYSAIAEAVARAAGLVGQSTDQGYGTWKR